VELGHHGMYSSDLARAHIYHIYTAHDLRKPYRSILTIPQPLRGSCGLLVSGFTSYNVRRSRVVKNKVSSECFRSMLIVFLGVQLRPSKGTHLSHTQRIASARLTVVFSHYQRVQFSFVSRHFC